MRFLNLRGLGEFLTASLKNESDEKAAEMSCEKFDEFLQKIGMWFRLKDFKMPEEEIQLLSEASMILPDYKNNPRVATESEMLELIQKSYSM